MTGDLKHFSGGVLDGKWGYATTRGLIKDGQEAEQGLCSIELRF
jgi:hypothetical protein